MSENRMMTVARKFEVAHGVLMSTGSDNRRPVDAWLGLYPFVHFTSHA